MDPVTTTNAIDQRELANQLLAQAKADGVELVGPNGLLNQLTATVLETALEAEMDEHLGYEKYQVEGRDGGNSRNGRRAKTVLTEIGPVTIQVPRDTDATFDPQIVKKRQRRLTGIDEIVLSLSAKGLTTGEIAAHFDDVYGATVSRDTISRITDKVLGEMAEWRNRPLDRWEVSSDRCESWTDGIAMPRYAPNKMPAGVKRRYFELIRTGISGSVAAQAVGVSLSCGSLWFIDAGSVRFVDTPISSRYLTQDDRIEIADGRHRRERVKDIAERIGKTYQSVYREIARNRKPDGTYQPWYAHGQAYQRRRRPKTRRLAADDGLRMAVAPVRRRRGRRAQRGAAGQGGRGEAAADRQGARRHHRGGSRGGLSDRFGSVGQGDRHDGPHRGADQSRRRSRAYSYARPAPLGGSTCPLDRLQAAAARCPAARSGPGRGAADHR